MGMLRLWLAIAVLLTHAQASITPLGGALAVSAFYVISGFYMQILFAEKFTRGEVLAFYKSRALRIFPLYLISLVASIPFASEVAHKVFESGNAKAIAFAVFENVFIIGQDFTRFLSVTPSGGLTFKETGIPASSIAIVGQAWSLAVEFGFYALAPFILRRSTAVVICALAASVAVRLTVAYFDPEPLRFGNSWNAFLPSEIGTFLLGSLAYRYYATRPSAAAGPYLLAVIVVCSLVVQKMEVVTYFGFVLLVAASIPFIFAWSRDNKTDRWIGELSYPIYLGHIVVIGLVGFHPLAVLALTALVAVPLVRYIEQPISSRRRQGNAPRQPTQESKYRTARQWR